MRAGGSPRERILWCLTHAFSGLQYKKIRPILCNLLKSIFSISLFLTFSPKFNIGHNFAVDWIPLPKRLNDNSVEMYISKHSLLNIYIFVTPILQKKSCEYRRTIESGAVSGNWDTEWRVAVTLSLREGFKKKTVKKRSGWPLWGGRGGHPPSAWPLLFVKILTHFCPL